MVLLPVVDGLERRGLSRALTSIVLVILLIASIMVIVGVLTVPLTYWLRRGSELGALLKERLQTLGNPLAFFEEIGNALSQVTGGDESASAVNLRINLARDHRRSRFPTIRCEDGQTSFWLGMCRATRVASGRPSPSGGTALRRTLSRARDCESKGCRARPDAATELTRN